MNQLTPKQSSSLAMDIYTISKIVKIEDAISIIESKYRNVFSISKDNLLKGRTGGAGFLKTTTAFGLVLVGKGVYSGHAFIIYRGSQFLADWLTNLNVMVKNSQLGQPVHDGFKTAFESVLPQLKEFIFKEASQCHTYHCIGHSLGAGLATLTAEFLKFSGKDPYLYTFGAPRVGLLGFAKQFTQSVSQQKIYRAYHKTDIVPCIPVWPFYHAPDPGVSYCLPSPGTIPSPKYHDMKLYHDSVKEFSWASLQGRNPPRSSEAAINFWLNSEGPAQITIAGIEMMSFALVYILKKAGRLAGMYISETSAATLTLIDQIAYILKRGIDLSSEITGMVLAFVKKVMRMLGLSKIVEAADITTAFLRDMFLRLHRKLMFYTQRALDQALAGNFAL